MLRETKNLDMHRFRGNNFRRKHLVGTILSSSRCSSGTRTLSSHSVLRRATQYEGPFLSPRIHRRRSIRISTPNLQLLSHRGTFTRSASLFTNAPWNFIRPRGFRLFGFVDVHARTFARMHARTRARVLGKFIRLRGKWKGTNVQIVHT